MRRYYIKIILTIFLTTFTQFVNCQVISSETIKKDVTTFLTDSNSIDYWPKVKKTFETEESKLKEHQYYLLYYGQGSKPEKLYNSLFLNTDRIQLRNLMTKNKFKKAIPLGTNLIEINPLDITT